MLVTIKLLFKIKVCESSHSQKLLRSKHFLAMTTSLAERRNTHMSGTPAVPGWYINFQAAVLKQLPRPGEIDQEIAEGWSNNQASLRKNLADCLLPPMPTYEPKPVQKWTESDGVIYFSVTSDGTTGEEWINRLGAKHYWVRDRAREILLSSEFTPTNGVTNEIALVSQRAFKSARPNLGGFIIGTLGLFKPNAEVACLIRDMFTGEDIKTMGFSSIVTVHSGSELLAVRAGEGLNVSRSRPDDLNHGNGFALAVVGSQFFGHSV